MRLKTESQLTGFKSKANAISQVEMRSMLFASGEAATKPQSPNNRYRNGLVSEREAISSALTSCGQMPSQIAHCAQVLVFPRHSSGIDATS